MSAGALKQDNETGSVCNREKKIQIKKHTKLSFIACAKLCCYFSIHICLQFECKAQYETRLDSRICSATGVTPGYFASVRSSPNRLDRKSPGAFTKPQNKNKNKNKNCFKLSVQLKKILILLKTYFKAV